MPTALNKDILYLNNVMFGNPMRKASLGFFAITKTDVVFVPRHTQEHSAEGTLDVQHYMHTTDVYSYDDMPIQEVIPAKAQELDPMAMSEYMRKMSMEIEGSTCVALAEMTNIKVGMMRVIMSAGDKSFWVNLGIAPRKKKTLRDYLEANPIVGSEYTKPSTIVGEEKCESNCLNCESNCANEDDTSTSQDSSSLSKGKMAMAGCAFLIVAIGFVGSGEKGNKLHTPQVSTIEIEAVFAKASEMMKQANKSLEESGEKMALANRLKFKSENLFSEMKTKLKTGEKKSKLREMALQVRSWDKQEKKMRQEACAQSTQSKTWALSAQELSMKGNSMLLKALSDNKSKMNAQNSIRASKEAMATINNNVRPGFESCENS